MTFCSKCGKAIVEDAYGCVYCGHKEKSNTNDKDEVVSFIQKLKVKKEPVNIDIQTVLALVPIVDLWAAYRIEKFRFWCMLYL